MYIHITLCKIYLVFYLHDKDEVFAQVQAVSNVNVCFDSRAAACKKTASHFHIEKLDTEHGHPSFLGGVKPKIDAKSVFAKFQHSVSEEGRLKFLSSPF